MVHMYMQFSSHMEHLAGETDSKQSSNTRPDEPFSENCQLEKESRTIEEEEEEEEEEEDKTTLQSNAADSTAYCPVPPNPLICAHRSVTE